MLLTIGQVASYAGVTVRAVRHYHQVGLLPEPERDASGYRRYGAPAVVALIKIRTLADAGVPLSEIDGLLHAGPAEFAAAIERIDSRLAEEIARKETSRKQIAQLAAGDVAALPPEVITYLQRLRELGVSERILAGERDGWIIMAARYPNEVLTWIPGKFVQLQDPRMVRLYQVLSQVVDAEVADDRLLIEVADIMISLLEESQWIEPDDELPFELLDGLADDADPRAERLREKMRERGWDGWTRQRRVARPPS